MAKIVRKDGCIGDTKEEVPSEARVVVLGGGGKPEIVCARMTIAVGFVLVDIFVEEGAPAIAILAASTQALTAASLHLLGLRSAPEEVHKLVRGGLQ